MFLHKLALRMGRTVTELTATMTTSELISWMAYARTYPIGDEEREDMLFARLCSVVANASGMKRRGGGQITPKDFVLFQQKNFTDPLTFMRGAFGRLVKKRK